LRNLITLEQITSEELHNLAARSVQFGQGGRQHAPTLKGAAIGIYFSVSSSRTRTAFWRAATLLGADTISFGAADLQISTGESLDDTGRVLGSYLDSLVVRTNGDIREMYALSANGRLGVVNALSEGEHPTQAIADLGVLLETFGSLDGLHIAYVGEGNSTANALALAVLISQGCRLSLITPPGYGLPDRAKRILVESDLNLGRIVELSRPDDISSPVDVVYTSRWRTMGVERKELDWQQRFMDYRVDARLLARLGSSNARIMHDLPAMRGEDIDFVILDGPRSIAWRQAESKLFSAMYILELVNSPTS
jgi:ornithine carbamoyltransferase